MYNTPCKITELGVDEFKIITRYALRPPKSFRDSAKVVLGNMGVEWMYGVERWSNLNFNQMVRCCDHPFVLHSTGPVQSLLWALEARNSLEFKKAPKIWKEQDKGFEMWKNAVARGDGAKIRRGLLTIEVSLLDLDTALSAYTREEARLGEVLDRMGTKYITGESKVEATPARLR
jgi:hypothetical protein